MASWVEAIPIIMNPKKLKSEKKLLSFVPKFDTLPKLQNRVRLRLGLGLADLLSLSQ